MSEPTKAPWELLRIGTPIEDWSGAQFVIRAAKAPGGLAIVVGGLGPEEELANARLITIAGNFQTRMLKMLGAAKDGFLSYQYGNSATDLAEEMADAINKLLAEIKKVQDAEI